MMNIVNGGQHADNSVDVQEFMVMPLGFESFSDALRAGVEIFHALKKVLKSRKLNTNVGDEGGFAPDLPSNTAALDLILEAITKAGYKPGEQIWIAIDVAATELYDSKRGVYTLDGKEVDSAGMVEFLAGWAAKYPICSIEDGLQRGRLGGLENADPAAWQQSTIGRRRLVRDQHQAAPARHHRAHCQQHPDQGQPDRHPDRDDRCIQLAQRNGFTTVTSHRSGETEDSTIADLAVALVDRPDQDRQRLAHRSDGEV